MKKKVHVYFSGRVQGVGFRFTAIRLAEELGILGWVSNLADGRVEMLAEGTQERVEYFIAKINSTFSRYIKNTEVIWEPATGEFTSFGVKY
jgi:acylphosphatase